MQSVDAGAYTVLSPVGSSCDSTISPVVELKNWGSLNLTSATIIYQIDGGTLQSYNWSGNLLSLGSTTFGLPSLSVPDGIHIFTVYSTNPNSTADQNPANDTLHIPFSITAVNGLSLPESEGFESAWPEDATAGPTWGGASSG